MTTAPKTLYAVMGIAENVDDRSIREAYKHLALRHHPDKKCLEEKQEDFAEIVAAYKTLSDPAARRSYDALLLNDRICLVAGVMLKIILHGFVSNNARPTSTDSLYEVSNITCKHGNVFQQNVTVRTVDLLAGKTLFVPERLSLHKVRKRYVFRSSDNNRVKVVHLDVDQSADDNLMVDLETGDVHVDYYTPLNDLLSGAKVALGLPGDRLLEFDLQPRGRTRCVPFCGRGLLCGNNEQPGALYVHVLLVLPANVPPYILRKHFASIEAATAADEPVLVFRAS